MSTDQEREALKRMFRGFQVKAVAAIRSATARKHFTRGWMAHREFAARASEVRLRDDLHAVTPRHEAALGASEEAHSTDKQYAKTHEYESSALGKLAEQPDEQQRGGKK